MFNEVSVKNLMRHCFLLATDASNLDTDEKEEAWITTREEYIEGLIADHYRDGNMTCYIDYPCECKDRVKDETN